MCQENICRFPALSDAPKRNSERGRRPSQRNLHMVLYGAAALPLLPNRRRSPLATSMASSNPRPNRSPPRGVISLGVGAPRGPTDRG